MRQRTSQVVLPLLIVCFALSGFTEAQEKKKKRKKARRPNRVFAKIKDDPKLPRVLLIGDSISIGYTLAVRKELDGKANVHRIPTNGGPTTRGLAQIDKWLGKGKWDVIHFNWGLHDLKFMQGNRQVPLDAYEENLKKLTARLKKTGAKLIWCSTTPVPKGVTPRRTEEDVLAYNRVAAKIAKENKVVIDDLYTFAKPRLSEIQRPKDVHFTRAGSKALAKPVAKSILSAIKK